MTYTIGMVSQKGGCVFRGDPARVVPPDVV